MHRRLFPAAAAAIGALALPATAHAAIIEIGQTSTPATPTCPTDCLAVTRTTGYQSKIGGPKGGFMKVRHDGRIVAWSISLGNPSTKQIKFFNKYVKGVAQAQITILQPGKQWNQRVVAQGEPQRLAPYFGTTPQFALQRSIPVKKGQLVALTVPTWAPALSSSVGSNVEWRGARKKGACEEWLAHTEQTRVNGVAQYYCVYKARLTYSATLIPTPKPTATTTTKPKS
jgi:hypothetical protein